MARQTARWTIDQLHRLPDDGNRYELVRGELLVTPPPSVAHESVADVLARILDRYAEAEQLGRVSRPRAVVRIANSQAEPDLTVRPVPEGWPSSWGALPLPHLVVEILSNTTRRRDHVQKRELYMRAGIPFYWIVDRETRTIRSVRPNMEDVVSAESLEWHPHGASRPLIVDVAAVFRDALGPPA